MSAPPHGENITLKFAVCPSFNANTSTCKKASGLKTEHLMDILSGLLEHGSVRTRNDGERTCPFLKLLGNMPPECRQINISPIGHNSEFELTGTRGKPSDDWLNASKSKPSPAARKPNRSDQSPKETLKRLLLGHPAPISGNPSPTLSNHASTATRPRSSASKRGSTTSRPRYARSYPGSATVKSLLAAARSHCVPTFGSGGKQAETSVIKVEPSPATATSKQTEDEQVEFNVMKDEMDFASSSGQCAINVASATCKQEKSNLAGNSVIKNDPDIAISTIKQAEHMQDENNVVKNKTTTITYTDKQAESSTVQDEPSTATILAKVLTQTLADSLFHCDRCKKQFRTSAAYKMHLKTHELEASNM